MIVLSWRGGFTQLGVGVVVLVVCAATGDTAAGVELAFDAPHPVTAITKMPSKTRPFQRMQESPESSQLEPIVVHGR
jgi:threonine synthase